MTVSVQVDVENTNVEHSTAANKEISPITPRPVEQTALLTTEEQPQVRAHFFEIKEEIVSIEIKNNNLRMYSLSCKEQRECSLYVEAYVALLLSPCQRCV